MRRPSAAFNAPPVVGGPDDLREVIQLQRAPTVAFRAPLIVRAGVGLEKAASSTGGRWDRIDPDDGSSSLLLRDVESEGKRPPAVSKRELDASDNRKGHPFRTP